MHTAYSRFSSRPTRKRQGEHGLLVKGDVIGESGVLCRVQSECITGMVLDSADCDCFAQHRYSMQFLADARQGVLFFLRQEGRGLGLTTKIRALERKNLGEDTFTATERLGFPADVRQYEIVANVLNNLRIHSIQLITCNPEKREALSRLGVVIDDVCRTPMFITDRNRQHLLAKSARGHSFITVSNVK